jgi:hypothetical protein
MSSAHQQPATEGTRTALAGSKPNSQGCSTVMSAAQLWLNQTQQQGEEPILTWWVVETTYCMGRSSLAALVAVWSVVMHAGGGAHEVLGAVTIQVAAATQQHKGKPVSTGVIQEFSCGAHSPLLPITTTGPLLLNLPATRNGLERWCCIKYTCGDARRQTIGVSTTRKTIYAFYAAPCPTTLLFGEFHKQPCCYHPCARTHLALSGQPHTDETLERVRIVRVAFQRHL